MQIEKISFDHVKSFTARDIHYQTKPEDFTDFVAYMPNEEDLLKAARDRKNFSVNRPLIHGLIKGQYEKIQIHESQAVNLNLLLDSNTFTIITAHQPCLFTGPLYYVTKIFSAVKLASRLNENQDGLRFIPIFINGGEDHDFDEICSVNLFHKTISWHTDAQGSVGRLSLDKLDEAIAEACDVLGNSVQADEIKSILTESMLNSKNYNDYVFRFVNKLLGHTGMLMFSMDDPEIKRAIIPIIEKEVLQGISHDKVVATQEAIESKLGYKPQAFAREINMFYMGEHSRARIEKNGDIFQITDSELQFTEEEMKNEIAQHPEKFSPNVVTRPLMQEAIFPNVAYVGGGGELAYWMERKTQFLSFGVYFPALIRRNSLMILSKSQVSTMEKLQIPTEKWFDLEDEIIRSYIENQTDIELDLSAELEGIRKAFEEISFKAESIDPTLKNTVLAEGSKVEKTVEQLEGRIRRSLKKQEEVHVNQIKNLKQKLFPGNNGLQERSDNYLQYYLMLGNKLENVLLNELDPLDKRFLIVSDVA